MPPLIRLYVVNVAIGFGLAAAFVGLLLALDVAGLRRLVLASDIGWLAVLMMVVFNGIVFAGVQFAIAVMRMAEPGEGPRGGRRLRLPGARHPVPVPAARAAVPAGRAGRREPRQP
jgi:hypothetical protein